MEIHYFRGFLQSPRKYFSEIRPENKREIFDLCEELFKSDLKNKNEMLRPALRYAIDKMSEDLRAKAMKSN
ncbi:MAG: hypothetical protein PHG79_09845 [Methanosarcina sp.]|nr:hypothetical protein [Methanosarcina sp.]